VPCQRLSSSCEDRIGGLKPNDFPACLTAEPDISASPLHAAAIVWSTRGRGTGNRHFFDATSVAQIIPKAFVPLPSLPPGQCFRLCRATLQSAVQSIA
jgi:hypothetical protein